MKGLELEELCEDLMIQLHGVQYVDMDVDLSFKMLHKQVSGTSTGGAFHPLLPAQPGMARPMSQQN